MCAGLCMPARASCSSVLVLLQLNPAFMTAVLTQDCSDDPKRPFHSSSPLLDSKTLLRGLQLRSTCLRGAACLAL